jgi:hypothetical protein
VCCLVICLQSTDYEVIPGLGGVVDSSAAVGGLLAVVGTTGLLLVGATDCCKLRLKCDGTRAETIFRLSAKRTSPFKSTGASVQSTTGNRSVRIRVSNAGYTVFRGSVKSTGYPLHSPVSPSLPLPCVTVCHHVSAGQYYYIQTENFITSSVW